MPARDIMGRKFRGRNKSREPKNRVLESLVIQGVAAEGKAIAKAGEQVVFVPFGAPGDVVDVQVRKSRSSYLEGVITRILKPSPDRVVPFCSHFGLCGGCRWQHLPYEKQLQFKQQQVLDSLQRIGRADLSGVDLRPILGSEQERFYRNKLEYTFSNRRWLTEEDIRSGAEVPDREALGFHIPGYFDKVLDIQTCYLQAEPSNQIRLSVKAFALENGLSFYDLRRNEGLLRNLVIRNTPGGQVMVLVVFGQDEEAGRTALMEHIRQGFPRVTTLAWVLNPKGNSSLDGLQPVLYSGSPWLEESLEELRFRVGPLSFFQTNSLQARRLYGLVREFAGLSGHELVYDLYTGTGTIALFLARHAREVVGIEYVQEAVDHARMNAGLNQLPNARFFAGDMAMVLDEVFLQREGYPHVVVTDPPRAGMHPRVVKQLLQTGADRIVYVSCNPATLARDVELLGARYRLARVQAVDMFPHTHHVESVVLLERIG
jgi:23S rRNA (uracil1939-C5)-methyltransferase